LDEVHIVQDPPDKETIRQLWEQSKEPLNKFFNVRGTVYKELNLKEKLAEMSDEEKLDLLASNGKLLKRPIVTDGQKVTLGFDSKTFAEIWGT
jgi:arsenate reductase